MGRAPCCSKVGLHKGAWSLREDKVLTDYILTHGEGKWKSLPTNAGLLRCGKSCRLRWMNYLRPGIKRGNITPEEDQLIINLHSVLGNRWSQIAQKLPGRTDNEIKNHFNTHLRKRMMIDDDSTPINKVSERTKTSPKKKKKKGSDKSSDHDDSTFTETTDHISLPQVNTVSSSASLNTSSENGGLTSRSSSSSSTTEVSNFSWPLIELDDTSECDDLLMSDLSSMHLLPIDDDNQELEKLYDEYLQLLS